MVRTLSASGTGARWSRLRRGSLRCLARAVLAPALAMVGLPGGVAGSAEVVIHTFTGGKDGAVPYGALLTGNDGVLYGTTSQGGTGGFGTVFKLTPPANGKTVWTKSVIYSFAGGGDGNSPVGTLVADAGGALYGTTAGGDVSSDLGTVFKLNPPVTGKAWIETVLYRFQGGVDGSTPRAGLLLDRSGTLYGTTVAGGGSGACTGGCGTVFRLAPPTTGSAWTETVLYGFLGGDGAFPEAALVTNASGGFFGTTVSGGNGGFGTVFKVAAPAAGPIVLTRLYNFVGGGKDGANPNALLPDKSGGFYGTTVQGGAHGYGTVFKLSPPVKVDTAWSETVLFSFKGGTDEARSPWAGLIMGESGALYGTTLFGGTGNNGAVFKLTAPVTGAAPWSATMLYGFEGGRDGANPYAAIVSDASGALYGTTTAGGSGNVGTVFQLTGTGFQP